MKTKEEFFEELMQNLSFRAWYESPDRTELIKDLAKAYPFPTYKIKEGAPYGIACEGTIVHLHSYSESGNVGVIVLAKDKLPQAIEHEKRLFAEHKEKHPGKTEEDFHKQNILVHIDPVYLEPYFPPAEEAEQKTANL